MNRSVRLSHQHRASRRVLVVVVDPNGWPGRGCSFSHAVEAGSGHRFTGQHKDGRGHTSFEQLRDQLSVAPPKREQPKGERGCVETSTRSRRPSKKLK